MDFSQFEVSLTIYLMTENVIASRSSLVLPHNHVNKKIWTNLIRNWNKSSQSLLLPSLFQRVDKYDPFLDMNSFLSKFFSQITCTVWNFSLARGKYYLASSLNLAKKISLFLNFYFINLMPLHFFWIFRPFPFLLRKYISL